MKLTPLDIHQQQFKTKFRGFDRQEVESFLDQAADSLETQITENQKIREQNERLKLEGEGYRKREEAFKRVMLNAQKTIDQMETNARKSADLIIAEAEVRAEKILNGAHNRLSQLHEDIAELKRQRMQIELQIRSIIESHSKLLEISHEEASAADAADAKVKLFRKGASIS